MSDTDSLRLALCGTEKPKGNPRREARAARTRAQALSPTRILLQVLFLPVAITAITISVFVRTSPYERQDALRHLAAMTGCDTAEAMGLAPAFEGELGYHKRNDPDGDGVACGDQPAAKAVVSAATETPADAVRISGAKFLRP